ncbi:MAG: hypothetical protein KGZ58_01750 [Ignavibacteriales bacterium]|nr:hypothetical protein [Ignavibacteriales bacterium]
MDKKFWIAFVAVFVAGQILDFLIHGVLLTSTYAAQPMGVFRPMDQMNNMLLMVVGLIVSFFLTMIYSKNHEGKGMMEGVRFGLFVGFITATPMAYATYATSPITYSLAMQWFLYGMIKTIILGIALSMVYGKPQTA